VDPALFDTFCDLAYQKAGIHLTADKATMVSARLGRRLRALGLRTEEQYRDLLCGRGGEGELVHFLDAISTNHTYFFREHAHFEHVAREAERWLREGRRRFRFWSAGTASGEEAYTLAMVLEEAFAGADVDYRILATDISTRALSVAREGVYGEAQAARIPRRLREQYFTRARDAEGKVTFRALPALRGRIVFARLNLARPPFPMTGPIDVVLCRNVMLYFDRRVKEALIGEVERVLGPGGLLFIGDAETLRGIASSLCPVCPSVYALPLPGDELRDRGPHAAR
jgi:chemotaxis protein methyltransferase CheR